MLPNVNDSLPLRLSVCNTSVLMTLAAGLADLGFRIEDILDQEHDAACGNSDSGRLAACFLDSLASLDYSAWGYGLAYQRSLYKQELIDGQQVEIPDNWLNFNPWELARHDVTIDV
jgi:glycogen phosphorylase